MPIQHLQRDEIDDTQWDAHIEEHGTPYARSWYLDTVTDGYWNALVLDDYDAVLPLPYNRKLFGLPQLYQPILCQQLAHFEKEEDARALLEAIPDSYKRVNYPLRFNPTDNGTLSLRQRTNLVLPLEKPIGEIQKGYSKSLRKRLRKAESTQTVEAAHEMVEELITIYQNNLNERLNWSAGQYQKVKQLIEAALVREAGYIYRVRQEDETTAIGFFLLGQDRIVNLFGASTMAGRSGYSMHLLLDHMIQIAKAEELKYFDFEGSEIPGVATFFRSYGAQEETYFQYERNTLPAFINWSLETVEKINRGFQA